MWGANNQAAQNITKRHHEGKTGRFVRNLLGANGIDYSGDDSVIVVGTASLQDARQCGLPKEMAIEAASTPLVIPSTDRRTSVNNIQGRKKLI